ncbi:DUF397 domain-containing protein [Actinomadura sp. KC216]|uniref:DUF397 domain-containing protein n=1 Tax=Actinomadura sp. KC216 TaxID=2530370 RepID=UPI0010536EB2|nr:DUF397 domain-containing protein [Actinomadura sp. KC216]TDB90798.1 DUF397 domain-containing protein [Actinomadura sp. KC216]
MDLIQSTWRKSSYSGANGGECIEVARTPIHFSVRDSKDPHGPKLTISHHDFRHLTQLLKNL